MSLLKNIILGQIVLYLSILTCFLIKPSGLTANNGISYFGIFFSTLIPYVIGIVGSSLLLFIGLIKNKSIFKDKFISTLLLILLPLSILLVIFPYNVNNTFSNIHQTIGVLIFVSQLIVSLILAIESKRFNVYLFLIVEIFGGIISAYYLFPQKGYLIEGQLIFQLGFGLLMINYLKNYESLE